MSGSSITTGAPGVRARALVVEADLGAVFVLRHFFALAGFDVDCAAGPNEGLRLLNRARYDTVITDFDQLPGGFGDGLYLTGHARHCHPSACLVILLPKDAVLRDQDVQDSGVDICQRKPVDLGALMGGIARVLNRPGTSAPDLRNAPGAPGPAEGL